MIKTLALIGISISNPTIVSIEKSNISIYETKNKENEDIKNNNELIWENIGIDYGVKTKKSGTQTKTDKASRSTVMSGDYWYNYFRPHSPLEISGEILLHTHTSQLIWNGDSGQQKPFLYVEPSQSHEYNRSVWTWREEGLDTWNGWAHQTSYVEITLEANYIEELNIIKIQLDTFIYARTAGAVNKCWTNLKIDSIKFSYYDWN